MATIKEIQAKLEQITTPSDPYLQELVDDSRTGVQKLLAKWHKNYLKQQQILAEFEQRCQFEKELTAQGYRYIAGVDEVGRGPLAGPVVAAAVILPTDFAGYEVNDSKKLSEQKRLELYDLIKAEALAIGVSIVDNETIDKINIYEATKQAMLKAIGQLPQCDYLLLDAMVLDTRIPQKKIIKGDSKSISIAAASIIAKVTRDQLMKDYAKEYPGYDFEHNMGYGTKSHLIGLEKQGITPIHRKTFAPVKDYL